MSKGPPPEDFDDNPEWTDEDIAHAVPADQILPPHIAALLVRRRGAQQALTKQAVTIRLDRDVVAKLRATGRGWQSRVNAILREAIV